ncbi:MAG: ABC transporter ATP-binding protein [Alphaproteobacteria bacterium]|uniref:ABC transporter ATP-binding protein n=1 Tax=Candidatus Nitrobium versatile TaxID=2884831 RepID=A0A953J5B0_9BACT|nr:ABC transporter ATP-binding protein [Candidatus Nitrobium versatile]
MTKDLIRIESLEKSFYTPAGELKVLKGISETFSRGEMVGIVGASGAGKSTFLHILGTLDTPTSGTVIYRVSGRVEGDRDDEVNPFALSNTELAFFRNRVIGFVFQFHYLLPEFSALENVMMPGLIAQGQGAKGRNGGELRERAEKLLDELGLFARRTHKPGELSGGEQQRVAVARALLLEPEVVLADEPTGNLDTATGEELFRLLQEINARRSITFIIVTHNESLSRRCHRIVEMADGRLKGGK